MVAILLILLLQEGVSSLDIEIEDFDSDPPKTAFEGGSTTACFKAAAVRAEAVAGDFLYLPFFTFLPTDCCLCLGMLLLVLCLKRVCEI